MQKIRSILKIGSAGASLCDAYGSNSGVTLELTSGTSYILEFELRSEAVGESAVLPDYPLDDLPASSCYCALDSGCANSDDPPLLIFTGVTLHRDEQGHPLLTVPLNGNAAGRITELLDRNAAMEFVCELGGFDQTGMPVFAWQFPLTMRSRVYRGNGSETMPDDPAYFTAVQVQAIAAGLENKIAEVEKSIPEIPEIPEVTSGSLTVTDQGGYFKNTTLENVLQEIGAELDGLEHILEGI